MLDRNDAKTALDKIIKKSRVHLYKPIQIAEILYRDRVIGDIDLSNLEDYRTRSKKWRDEISRVLLGRICTSSARFQDDVFNSNAIPPSILEILGSENRNSNGAVEAYIYGLFSNKHKQLDTALNYCKNATVSTFNVGTFIDSFWNEPGLKRSLDKIYEIIVYALFLTLIEVLNIHVDVSVDSDNFELLAEFESFAKKVMNLDFSNPICSCNAKVYRVGVTNAADRGIDMYSNWGPTIQIKHLSLDVELAESIVNSVSSDRIIIVCKNVEKGVILSLLTQIGWKSHIQSIITEDDLILWYEKALRGPHSDTMGEKLLQCLRTEIAKEFPSVETFPEVLRNRHYEEIDNSFWK